MKVSKKQFISTLVSIVLIALIVIQLDLDRTLNAFKSINYSYLLPIIPVYIVAFLIRAYRWRLFLYNEYPGIMSLFSSLFIGYGMNNLLPARAGEFYRAYYFGKKEKINKVQVFASVFLERIFDGFVLFLLLFAFVSFLYSGDLFLNISKLAGLVFIGGFILLLSVVKMQKSGNKRKKIKKFILKFIPRQFFSRKLVTKLETFISSIFEFFDFFLKGLSVYNSSNLVLISLLYTFVIWALEGLVVFLVIKSFGVAISFAAALFTLTIVAFATLIPAGPAGIGPFQWGYIVALGVFNISKEISFAISIVNQTVAMVIVLSIAAFFVWKDHININEIENSLTEEF